jgi:hypothetical protein
MPALITYNGKSVINSNPYITPMDVGAYSVFNNLFQLNNLPSERRKPGMLAYILETNDFFVLKTSNWEFTINDWQPLSIEHRDEKLFYDRETPNGLTDGMNTEFSLFQEPKVGSEHVYLNGLLQDSGELYDYTINDNLITFNEPPFLGSKVRCSYRMVDTISPQLKISDKEIPSGVADGINKEFFIKHYPELDSEHVYLNGLLQDESQMSDYVMVENKIIFNYPPLESSKIKCTYRFF